MVVIMGISGAIVVPHMLRSGQMGLQGATRTVITDILYAQDEANAQSGILRVVFDPTNNAYRLTDAAGTTLRASWKSAGGNGQNDIVSFDQDARFNGVQLDLADLGGGAVLEFNAIGSPTKGGTVKLTASGLRYHISIAPFTGQVTIAPVTRG